MRECQLHGEGLIPVRISCRGRSERNHVAEETPENKTKEKMTKYEKTFNSEDIS